MELRVRSCSRRIVRSALVDGCCANPEGITENYARVVVVTFGLVQTGTARVVPSLRCNYVRVALPCYVGELRARSSFYCVLGTSAVQWSHSGVLESSPEHASGTMEKRTTRA